MPLAATDISLQHLQSVASHRRHESARLQSVAGHQRHGSVANTKCCRTSPARVCYRYKVLPRTVGISLLGYKVLPDIAGMTSQSINVLPGIRGMGLLPIQNAASQSCDTIVLCFLSNHQGF